MKEEFYDKTEYPKEAFIAILIPILVFPFLLLYFYQEKVLFYILIFITLILIVSAFSMYKTALSITISKDGVFYQLKSFSKENGEISFNNIQHIKVVKLDYKSKFGGWGKRKNRNGIAYIFNDVLFLEIQTFDQVYYFSISNKKKEECILFVQLLQEYTMPKTV